MPTPTLVPEDYVPGSKLIVDDEMGDLSMRNIRKEPVGLTNKKRFWRNVKDVLTMQDFAYMRQHPELYANKPFWFYFSRLFMTIVLLISYLVQLLFPLVTVLALISVYARLPSSNGGDWFYCFLAGAEPGEQCFENFWEKKEDLWNATSVV